MSGYFLLDRFFEI